MAKSMDNRAKLDYRMPTHERELMREKKRELMRAKERERKSERDEE